MMGIALPTKPVRAAAVDWTVPFRRLMLCIIPLVALRSHGQSATRAMVDWFIPYQVRSTQTNWELARTFVFTHIFGPMIAQPLWIYLYSEHKDVNSHVYILTGAICAFWTLPFVLRATGDLWIVSLTSFQGLAMATLYGGYHYGGFISPFIPWLIVSLLLGLFYLSKNTSLVLALFTADILVFLVALWYAPSPYHAAPDELRALRWLSISTATLYMTWMANYYSTVVSLQSELETEAQRSRATSIELERARAVAEATDKARSRFLATMSHELRTPLHIIIGYSEILLEDIKGDPQYQDQCARDITRINTAGKHLLSLVSRVLSHEVVHTDAQTTTARRFRLGALCDDIVASALPLVERNNNHLTITCPERDFELITDVQKLRQVGINLLANAGKFTTNGTVKIALDIRRGPHDHLLQMAISDTGIGISSDITRSIFEEYEQGSVTIEAKFGGTGIGLSLSRRFANLLGGDLAVTSVIGSGSCFTITVPTNLASYSIAPPQVGLDR